LAHAPHFAGSVEIVGGSNQVFSEACVWGLGDFVCLLGGEVLSRKYLPIRVWPMSVRRKAHQGLLTCSSHTLLLRSVYTFFLAWLRGGTRIGILHCLIFALDCRKASAGRVLLYFLLLGGGRSLEIYILYMGGTDFLSVDTLIQSKRRGFYSKFKIN